MRKFSSLLMVVLLSIMSANAKMEPILVADFEGGVIPAGWTQEVTGVAPTLAWTVQSKAEATRPASVRRGDYRLSVVNPGTLYGTSVRLISPVMNLSQSHEPRLTFSRAALSSSGYLDTLRVYYRTSASAGWIMLNEYATPTSGNNWADEALQLPAANATYQIAFEFVDGTARGLSIDEIVVEPTPHCTTVSNVQLSATSTDAVVAFNADGYADSVVYVVTKTRMDYPEDAKNPVAKGSLYDWYLELHGLETGTQYYLYLRSSCSENESGFTDWVETPFSTKYVAVLPYTESYNNLAKLDNFAFTPEFTSANLKGLQLTMDVTSASLSTTVKDNSFIIGVVKSPDDLSSFKALDTIYMDYVYQKKYCAISLAEYEQGDGQYLAFASSFAEPNAITAGTIRLAAASVLTPNHVTLTEVKDNSVKVSARLHGTTTGWNVRIYKASDYVNGGALPSATPLWSNTELLSGSSVVVTDDALAGQTLLVYTQAVNGEQSSAWSFPVTVKMPVTATAANVNYTFTSASCTYDLRELAVECQGTAARIPTDFLAPYAAADVNLNTSALTFKGSRLDLNGAGNYVILPKNELAGNQLFVRLAAPIEGSSAIKMGVMTDPYDWSTFDSLATFVGKTEYTKYTYDFPTPYAAAYIALVAITPQTETGEAEGSLNAIAEIAIQPIPTCLEPLNLKAEPTGNSATITWVPNTMTSFHLVVSENANLSAPLYDAKLTGSSKNVTGLKPLTRYYCQVYTVCEDNSEIASDSIVSFRTLCPETISVPYTFDFEGNDVDDLPCGTVHLDATIRDYPVVSSHVALGNHSLAFGLDGGDFTETAGICTAEGAELKAITPIWVLPELVGTAVSDVQVSFSIHSHGSPADYVAVGVMTDPADAETFVEVERVRATTGGWGSATVNMAYYQGNGKYIAFKRLGIGESIFEYATVMNYQGFNIDNVVIDNLPECRALTRFELNRLTQTSASFVVEGQKSDSIEFVLSTSANRNDAILDTIMYVENGQVAIQNLTLGTTYYAFARSYCDAASQGVWYSQPLEFQTLCEPQPTTYSEDFSTNNIFSCWVLLTDDATSKAERTSGQLHLTGNSRAVMPGYEVDGKNMKYYQITFKAATTSEAANNTAELQIGIATTPYSAAQILRTIKLTSEMLTYTVNFKDYDGDEDGNYGTFVVFRSFAGDANVNDVVIDDLTTAEVELCQMPFDVELKHVGAADITLDWRGEASKYEVLFALNNADPNTTAYDQAQVVTVEEKRVVYTPMGDTQYAIWVRSICEDDDTHSKWFGPLKAKTPCGVSAFPYTWDFEGDQVETRTYYPYGGNTPADAETALEPVCWAIYSGNYGNAYPRVKTNSGTTIYAHGGTNAVYMGQTSAMDQFMISPEIIGDLDTLQVTFWARAGYKAGTYFQQTVGARTLAIGTVTDPSNPASFELIETVTTTAPENAWYPEEDPEGTDYWRKYTVGLMGAKGKYLAIGVRDQNDRVSFDDVTIEKLADCPALSAAKFKAVDVFATTATATWAGKADAFKLTLVEGEDTLKVYENLTETSQKLEGLKMLTTYKLFLQSVCAGVESEPIQTQFETARLIPFAETFNHNQVDYPEEPWTGGSGDTLSIYGGGKLGEPSMWGWRTINDQTIFGVKHLKSNPCNVRPSEWIVSPLLSLEQVDPSSHVELSFDLAFTARESNTQPLKNDVEQYAFIVVVSEDGGETWSGTNSWVWSTNPGTYESLWNVPAEGKNYQLDLTRYAGKSIKFAFVSRFVSSATPGIGVDFHVANLRLKETADDCYDPTSLVMSEVDFTTAKLSWQGDATYRTVVEYGTDAEFNTVTVDTIAGGLEYNFNGLKSNTEYFVRIKQLCGVVPTEYVSTSFYTQANLPYAEAFNATTANWINYTSNGAVSAVFNRTANITRVAEAKNNGWKTSDSKTPLGAGHIFSTKPGSTNSNWLVSPLIDLSDAKTTDPLFLTFDAALTSSSSAATAPTASLTGANFWVVVSTDMGASFSAKNAWQWSDAMGADYAFSAISTQDTYRLNMAQYAGKKVIVALVMGSTPAASNAVCLNINNLKFENIEGCYNAKGLLVDSIVENNAYLRVAPEAQPEGMWQISYAKTGGVATIVTLSDVLTAKLELDYDTEYTAMARRICGTAEGDTLAWTAPITFSTAVRCPAPTELKASATENTINVSWQAELGENFQVIASTSATLADTLELQNVATTTATFNVEYDHTYYIFARVICGEGDSSKLAGPVLVKTPVSCPAVEKVNVSVYENEVTANWTATAKAQSYNVRICASQNAEDVVASQTVDTTTAVFTVDYNKNYYVYVQVVCGAGDESVWVASAQAKVGVGCPAPTGLALKPAYSSISATWTSTKGTDYEVRINKTNSADNALDTVFVSDPTALFSDLDQNTTYYVFVRTVCGENNESTWTSANTKTTEYKVTLIDENFNASSMPTGWTVYRKNTNTSYNTVALSANTTTVLYDYSSATSNARALRFYARNNANYAAAIALPATTVPYADLKLSFRIIAAYQSTRTAITNRYTATNYDKKIYIGNLTGNNFASIQTKKEIVLTTPSFTITTANRLDAYELVEIDLSELDLTDGQRLTISTAASSANYTELWIDDLKLEYKAAPTCIKPTGITTAVAATTADLAWYSDATTFDLQYNAQGETATLVEGITGTSYHLTGLAPETTYSYQLRTVCDGTPGEWTTAATFKTAVLYTAPTALAVSDVQTTTALATWQGKAPSYEVCVDGDEEHLLTTTKTQLQLTGLTHNAAHSVKVRGVYGVGETSVWTAVANFTTLNPYKAPTGVTAKAITTSGATLSWTGEAPEYEVKVGANTQTVTGTELVLTGLASDTQYSVQVRGKYSDVDFSDWTTAYNFRTSDGYIFREQFASSNLPTGWKQSQYTSTAEVFAGATLSLSDYGSWNNTAYGLGENNWGVNIYQNPMSAWMISPTIALDAEEGADISLKVNVAVTAWNSNSGYDLVPSDAKSFMIIVSTDGGKTWKKENSILMDCSGTADYDMTKVGNKAYEMMMDLSAYNGQTIQLAFCAESQSTTDMDFHMDDVRIAASASTCAGVRNLALTETTSTSAKLSWATKGNEQVAVVVTDANGTEVLRDTTVNAFYEVTGLTKQNTYTITVGQTCDFRATAASVSVVTPQGIRYEQPFNGSEMAAGWKTYEGKYASNPTLIEDANNNWNVANRYTTISGGNARMARVNISTSYCNKWLVSPEFDLTENAGQGIGMSFDLALTAYSASMARTNTGTDDRLLVAALVDGSWTVLGTWASTPGANFSFLEIPEKSMRHYGLDISSLAGKTGVRFAFYAESSVDNDDYYLWVSNLVINRAEVKNEEATLCSGEGWEDENFTVLPDELKPGQTKFLSKFVSGSRAALPDTIVTLTLTMNKSYFMHYNHTYAEEQHVTDYGFDFIAMNDGELRMRLNSANDCDSVQILTYTVVHHVRETLNDTICQGQTYSLNDKVYTTAGTYTDTVPTTVDGVQVYHITTLNLFVTPAPRYAEELYICYGGSIELEGKTYTESDVVEVEKSDVEGCLSYTTYTITALPDYRSSRRAVFCENYTDDSFQGLKKGGVYTLELSSKLGGCDSTIVLDLLQAVEGHVYDTIQLEDLPYVVAGKELMPVDAEEGYYDIAVESADCGEVTLHLLIGQPQGIMGGVSKATLAVSPNPVLTGAVFTVNGPAVAGTLTIYSATGSLYSTTSLNQLPCELSAPAVAGIYFVRYTTAYGVYESKLIVK